MTECMTVRQVAERFGCSTALVYDWVRQGVIGHLRLPGGSIRIRIAESKRSRPANGTPQTRKARVSA